MLSQDESSHSSPYSEGVPLLLRWTSSRSTKARRFDDSLLPCRLWPAGLGLAGEEGPMLRLRSCALAVVLAFLLLPLCPAWGWQRMLGGMLGRDSTVQYLSPLSPLHLPQLPHLLLPPLPLYARPSYALSMSTTYHLGL